jgi:hypothetical protein
MLTGHARITKLRARLLPLAVPALFGCTEPAAVDYFEGTVTSVWVSTDVFSNTQVVGFSAKRTGKAGACNDADVSVAGTTEILIPDDPAIKMKPTDLESAQVVRVWPPFPATDACPMQIKATTIWIMKLNGPAS